MLRSLRPILLLTLSATALLLGQDFDPMTSGQGAPGTSGTGGTAPSATRPPGADLTFMFVVIGGMLLFMWFFMLRPQKKEEKRRKDMLGATKKGDEVETIGGLRGEVESVGEQTVEVRLGREPGVVVTFSRAAVHRNLTQEAANAPKKA